MARPKMTRMALAEINASTPEINREKLASTTEEDIRRYQIEDGEDPDAPLPDYAPPPHPRAVRAKLGLSQEEFARLIRVPVGTVRNWEQDRVVPDPAARTLLLVLDRRPEETMKVLREAANTPTHAPTV